MRFGAPRPGRLSRYFRELGSGRRQSPKYPVGKTVSVSYEPGHVTNAALEPGGESYDFLKLGGGLVLVPFLIGLGLNTLYRVQHTGATPNLLNNAVTPFFKAAGLLFVAPFGLSSGFAYPLASSGAILLLVGTLLDDELGVALSIIGMCVLVPGTLGMMLRLVAWVNIELPERMEDPDPAVCRHAQTMITWIVILILVFFFRLVIFVVVQAVWLGGW